MRRNQGYGAAKLLSSLCTNGSASQTAEETLSEIVVAPRQGRIEWTIGETRENTAMSDQSQPVWDSSPSVEITARIIEHHDHH